jgi:hypothetical protein
MFAATLLAQNALASLPANLGAMQYLPGDKTPAFSIPVRGQAAPLTGPVRNAPFAPLLVAAVRPEDPFVGYMFASNSSLDGFLADGPSGCNFVFSAHGTVDDVTALQLRLESRLSVASAGTQAAWAGHLHFTNSSAADSLGSDLPALLGQWKSPSNLLTAPSLGAAGVFPRLDCAYAWCAWPSQEAAFSLAAASNQAGDAPCTMRNVSGSPYLLIDTNLPAFAPPCALTALATAAAAAGASGIVLGQRAGAALEPLGQRGEGSFSGGQVVTMVGAAAAQTLRAAAASAPGARLGAGFSTAAGLGQFAAVDSEGFLQEVRTGGRAGGRGTGCRGAGGARTRCPVAHWAAAIASCIAVHHRGANSARTRCGEALLGTEPAVCLSLVTPRVHRKPSPPFCTVR